ncbi:MAG: hypothetical protein RL385_669, partial [Pseudomonadota bacterium]
MRATWRMHTCVTPYERHLCSLGRIRTSRSFQRSDLRFQANLGSVFELGTRE